MAASASIPAAGSRDPKKFLIPAAIPCALTFAQKMACNQATEEFLSKLRTIEPSKVKNGVFHYPCRLHLKDGTLIDRAICVEDARGFTGDWWIHPDEVSAIEPSDERLPAELATKLYTAGESGMGYEIFTVQTDSGRRFTCITHNVVDFPQFPEGLRSEQIREVFPHQGRENYGTSDCFGKPPKFKWCYYLTNKSEQVAAGNGG